MIVFSNLAVHVTITPALQPVDVFKWCDNWVYVYRCACGKLVHRFDPAETEPVCYECKKESK